MELTILLILLILIILVIKNYYKENFSVQEVNQEFKQSFINDLKKTIEGTVLYDDNIKIRKFNNSTKLIVSNISVANPLQDSFFNQNITLKDNHLKYNLQALEHKTNVFTGYYISKPIQTVKKNKNYGFVFEYNPEKSFNNEAEIIIDFTKQKKEALDNIENINAIKNSQSYKNLPRKTVNVFTPMNTPLDIMPYFSKGDNDKDIKDAKHMGITDLNKKYELNEIVKGDSIFCATAITTSEVLTGIEIKNHNYTSETLVTHKSSQFKKIIRRTDSIKE